LIQCFDTVGRGSGDGHQARRNIAMHIVIPKVLQDLSGTRPVSGNVGRLNRNRKL